MLNNKRNPLRELSRGSIILNKALALNQQRQSRTQSPEHHAQRRLFASTPKPLRKVSEIKKN